jgi:WD40 repeat protein
LRQRRARVGRADWVRLSFPLSMLVTVILIRERAWDSLTLYVLRGHTSTVRCLKVIHNRPIAISGSRDSTLRVWDVQRGRMLRILSGHAGSVRSLDVCGNRVVSGSYDGTCRVCRTTLPSPYSSGCVSGGADERTALGRGHRRMSAGLPWTLQPDICSCV